MLARLRRIIAVPVAAVALAAASAPIEAAAYTYRYDAGYYGRGCDEGCSGGPRCYGYGCDEGAHYGRRCDSGYGRDYNAACRSCVSPTCRRNWGCE
jgi:hypothetical protein